MAARVSRRSLLKKGAAAAVGGGATAWLSGGEAAAQQRGAPAILTGTQGGRKVRAVIKYRPELPSIEEITLRAIGGRGGLA